jgi:hypothetical protein
MTEERFDINQVTYTIKKEAGNSEEFVVRKSGCRIYSDDKIEDCRRMLHTYARNQLLAEANSYQKMADRARISAEKLGTDPFHLGKFLR